MNKMDYTEHFEKIKRKYNDLKMWETIEHSHWGTLRRTPIGTMSLETPRFRIEYGNPIFPGCGLDNAFLKEANLAGAKLRKARMSGANLIDANLYDADLEFANMRGAELKGADLENSNLYGAGSGTRGCRD